MTNTDQSERIRHAIPPAISVLQKSQFDKRNLGDHGGWQYYTHHIDVDSDMSVTTWQLMFLRSAKNAGFDVPEEMVQAALEYVARCYDADRGCFTYGLRSQKQYDTVGSVAGGIISLSMGGKHQSEMARRAGNWLLQQPLEKYNSHISLGGNYHYGLHYCSQDEKTGTRSSYYKLDPVTRSDSTTRLVWTDDGVLTHVPQSLKCVRSGPPRSRRLVYEDAS